MPGHNHPQIPVCGDPNLHLCTSRGAVAPTAGSSVSLEAQAGRGRGWGGRRGQAASSMPSAWFHPAPMPWKGEMKPRFSPILFLKRLRGGGVTGEKWDSWRPRGCEMALTVAAAKRSGARSPQTTDRCLGQGPSSPRRDKAPQFLAPPAPNPFSLLSAGHPPTSAHTVVGFKPPEMP